MQNWVANRIVVSGSPDTVKHFICFVTRNMRTGAFSFENIIKPPSNFANRNREWQCINWGTKWDAKQPRVLWEKNSTSSVIEFLTPWTPPLPIISRLLSWLDPKEAGAFAGLNLDYKYAEEGGCPFVGHIQLLQHPEYRGDCNLLWQETDDPYSILYDEIFAECWG